MKVLFTKSNLIGSRIIRWATGEDVSHCALQWGPIVIHAALLGVEIWAYENFLDVHEVKYEFELPQKDDADSLANLVKKQGSAYDYTAVLWLGLSFLFKKVTGRLLPGPNKWASKRAFCCTEYLSFILLGEQDSLITPHQLYKKLTSNHV